MILIKTSDKLNSLNSILLCVNDILYGIVFCDVEQAFFPSLFRNSIRSFSAKSERNINVQCATMALAVFNRHTEEIYISSST